MKFEIKNEIKIENEFDNGFGFCNCNKISIL